MTPEEPRRWQAGDAIALREMWRGRVWAALPATVVADARSERMLYIPPGAVAWQAVDAEGRTIRLYTDDWKLAGWTTTWHVLSFSWPDRDHAVLAMWDPSWRLQAWYVNLETSLRRTPIGFDFVDHVLDVVVGPDRTSWRWKDEDELEEAIARGVFGPEQAAAFRREGERAARRLLEGTPPFDHDWSAWRPDPSWTVPVLPDGWEAVDEP